MVLTFVRWPEVTTDFVFVGNKNDMWSFLVNTQTLGLHGV